MNRFSFQIITKNFDITEYKTYLSDLSRIAYESSADVLQLRNKNLAPKDVYSAALYVKSLLSRFASKNRPLFIINDRPDIADIAGADGVHIGQDDFPLKMLKKNYPRLLAGVSAGNLEEALSAQDNGADYIGIGPVYKTSSKDDAGGMMDAKTIRELCGIIKIPVIAIGGIGVYNIRELSAHGINGVAVINAISGSVNPLKTAFAFRENINKMMVNKN